MNPLVSAIIPCYNHGRYLAASIDSVLNQTYRPVEVIVVDDGSTDNTEEVARTFGDRIKYIYQANAGPSVARNNAIRHSTGELIALLDADDTWRPSKLEVQVPTFNNSDNVGLVVSAYMWFNAESGESGTLVPAIDGDVQHELLRHCFVGALTAVFPRYVFDEVGDFDPSLLAAQDWDMWLRIARKYDIVPLTDVVADYRSEAGSVSRNQRRMFDNRMRLLTSDRMIHRNCAECRAALRSSRRGAHVSLSSEYCERARKAACTRNYITAIVLSMKAIRHDPNAVTRLAKRLLRTGRV